MKDMKFVGSRYNETANMDITEIAKILRSDIRAAIKSGEFPKGLKFSARIDRFSGGKSLHVYLSSLGDGGTILNPARVKLDRDEPHHTYSPWDAKPYTATASRVMAAIKSMMNSFNYDDSDTMTDYFHVRFYGDVTIDWRAEDEEKKAILASNEFPDLSVEAVSEAEPVPAPASEPAPSPASEPARAPVRVSALAVPVFYLRYTPTC